MQRIYFILEMVTIIFAFAAAWFWFRSSQAFAPSVNPGDLTAIKQWLDEIAGFNRQATLCAAISAIAHGLKYIAIRVGLS